MSALDPKDVLRFINARQPLGKCTGCGNTNFDILNEKDVNQAGLAGRAALTIFPFPDYDILKAKSADVVVLSCANCATIRLLARTPVAQWVAANPGPTTH